MKSPQLPKKYRPPGFEILFEDEHLIVGHKAAGFLTVAALWNQNETIHSFLNNYVRKGNPKSQKVVYVVHRLDQATSGVLIFAKSAEVQAALKDNWKSVVKNYYTIVHGKMPQKKGLITSYLAEDEDYVVRSTDDPEKGKLAQTEYTVVKETPRFSVLKINLLTGKKNQIRVHLSEAGHPIVGDSKYGQQDKKSRQDKAVKQTIKNHHLMLHSFSLVFTHPKTQEKIRVQADVPEYFKKLVDYKY